MPRVKPRVAKLLQDVKRQILRDPNSYNQGSWHCGTAMCIAGHVCFQSGLVDGTQKQGSAIWPTLHGICLGEDDKWEELAMRALGLDPDDFTSLFDGDGEQWPEPYGARWRQAEDTLKGAALRKAVAKIAADRIDYFIRTGE